MLSGVAEPFLFLVVLTCCLPDAAVCQPSGGSDLQLPFELRRLAFGSCAKQKYVRQPIWDVVAATQPDAFIWTGDAHYASGHLSKEGKHTNAFHFVCVCVSDCSSVACLREGYAKQSSVPEYAAFVGSKDADGRPVVGGMWDDHDYGVNDGGQFYSLKNTSQSLFLDFIGVPTDSPRRSRQGVYSSLSFGTPPHKTKLLMLDTRFFRDWPLLPSVGSIRLPGSAFIGALVRFSLAFFGFGEGYSGDVLGEDQWMWLEEQLTHSDAAVHVILSSIQIMTMCAVFESWGHFPIARQRLFSLLQRTKPKGLIFISGDVHFGEAIGKSSGVVEVTSSGLTHSCATATLVGPLCEPLLVRCPHMRLDHNATAYYVRENFGLLDVRFEPPDAPTPKRVHLHAAVLDEDGRERITANVTRSLSDDPSVPLRYLDEVPSLIRHTSPVTKGAVFAVLGLVMLVGGQVFVVLCVSILRLCSGKKKGKRKTG